MLYDPKWEVKIKPDTFSLESFIAWLEKQPEGIYCFSDWGECLLAKWLHSIDPQSHQIKGENGYIYSVNGIAIDTFRFKNIVWCEPRTFGGALKRAKAEL